MVIPDGAPSLLSIALRNGLRLNASGHPAEAVAYFQAGLGADSKVDAALWDGMACSFVRQGRLDDAVKAFETALQLGLPETLALLACAELARSLGALGRVEDQQHAYLSALDIVDEQLAASPSDSGLWTRKGFFLEQVGLLDEAAAAHRQAMDVDERGAAYVAEGISHVDAGDFDRALQSFSCAGDLIRGTCWHCRGKRKCSSVSARPRPQARAVEQVAAKLRALRPPRSLMDDQALGPRNAMFVKPGSGARPLDRKPSRAPASSALSTPAPRL